MEESKSDQAVIKSFNDPTATIGANPQVLFSWTAPLRAYKKRSKNVLRFYIALALLLSIIVFFFGDLILLVPIWAILFLFYVLTITPPPDVENKITKFGIESAGVTARWELLSEFYYITRFGFNIVVIVSHAPYYLHLYMVVPEDVKPQVTHILAEHLIFQEKPQRTITDRMIDFFSKLMPDDEEEAPSTSAHQMQKAASL